MEKISLEEQIKHLIELQGLDTQVFRLRSELEAIPKEVARLEDNFKANTATMRTLEDSVKTLQVKRKERELDLEGREANIKKMQTQLYQLKTNKEYTTMQQEIERSKADKSLVEDDIIKLLDEIDATNKKVATEKESLKSEEAKLNQEKSRLSGEAKEKEARLEALSQTRKAQAGEVDKTMLAKYERILKSKNGLAMAAVKGDACQGCYRVMPPQVINEIRMKQEIIFCGNCARMLYIPDE
jgi:predicted  nucleic acid-binding Zn-ribbon protein